MIFLTCALAIAFIVFSYYIVFTYPENQVSQITNVTEKATLVNNYRATSIQMVATLAQIFGGIAVLIGIIVALENLKVTKANLESDFKMPKRI